MWFVAAVRLRKIDRHDSWCLCVCVYVCVYMCVCFFLYVHKWGFGGRFLACLSFFVGLFCFAACLPFLSTFLVIFFVVCWVSSLLVVLFVVDALLIACVLESIMYSNTYIHTYTHTHTHRVVRNSLDPEFNQTFRLAVAGNDSDMELRVELWDWDRFDEDDHMGDVVLRLTIDKIVSKAANGVYPIISSDGMDYLKNGKGDKSLIHLELNYFPARVKRENLVTPLCI
jgi:hypothetical protein